MSSWDNYGSSGKWTQLFPWIYTESELFGGTTKRRYEVPELSPHRQQTTTTMSTITAAAATAEKQLNSQEPKSVEHWADYGWIEASQIVLICLLAFNINNPDRVERTRQNSSRTLSLINFQRELVKCFFLPPFAPFQLSWAVRGWRWLILAVEWEIFIWKHFLYPLATLILLSVGEKLWGAQKFSFLHLSFSCQIHNVVEQRKKERKKKVVQLAKVDLKDEN